MTDGVNIEHTRNRTHGKGVYGFFALLFFVAVAAWFGAVRWKEHLTLSGIIVDGESVVTKEEIVKLAQITSQTKLYDIDLAAVQQRIQANHFIKNVEVTRDAPSTIRISVEERTPLAFLSVAGNGELVFLDEEGYVLPHALGRAMFDFPVISGVDSEAVITVGQRLRQSDILAALDVLECARRIGSEVFHSISEVRIRTGHDMVLYSTDAGVPILFGRGNVAKKLVTLNAFWKKFLTEQSPEEIRYIDLRFEDQVIVSSLKRMDSQVPQKAS